MNAGHAYHGYDHHQTAPIGHYGYCHGHYGPPMMHPSRMRSAMSWGGQPQQLVKTAAAATELTYYVVPSKVVAADVVNLDSAKTVQGGTITIDTSDGVKVDGSNVVQTDIESSNGVIHVIDAVLLPQLGRIDHRYTTVSRLAPRSHGRGDAVTVESL